ncbi:hypothetical protein [Leptospira noguchii]|uniref:hypothetical protein n=1 Tax=Leptospira noguchii TaxID=28182 RepID=UPI0002DA7898|nr:hypothetical protein [Leptospira noguchii]UOG30916.1 hypothetical protein MAL06_02175 [Leptospira noguchii]
METQHNAFLRVALKNSAQRFPKGRSIDREILNSENNQKLRSAIFGLFRSLRIAK